MERVSSKIFEDFPSSSLYFDDLEEIVDAFVETCKTIEISTGEFKITNVDEIKALASKFPDGRFSDLKVQGYDPYITLDLRTFGARAYISDDSMSQRGIVSKVREILHRRRRIRPDLVLDAVCGVILTIGIWQINLKVYAIGAPLIFAAVGLVPFGVRLRMKNTVVVRTKYRNEVTSFFQRKKDDLLIAAISASLGAAASYVVTRFMQ